MKPNPLLAAPSNLTATTIGTTFVNLSWRNNANNQLGFVVQYSSNGGGSWTTVGTAPTTTATTYRVNGLVTQTRYSVRVAAWITPATLSAYSNVLQVTTR